MAEWILPMAATLWCNAFQKQGAFHHSFQQNLVFQTLHPDIPTKCQICFSSTIHYTLVFHGKPVQGKHTSPMTGKHSISYSLVQSWILFSLAGITSPMFNMAVHNFWGHHLMDDVLGEKWTRKLCTELQHFSSRVISQTQLHLKILGIPFSAGSFQRIQLSEATIGSAD